MTAFVWKIRRKLSAALLLASVACFGYGGCSSDLAYLVEDLAGYTGVVIYEEFYAGDLFYDDGFGFDFGFDMY